MPEGQSYRKKLIEVALPLEDINREAVHESYIYKGNPSSIHKWWAQRPLAACRAVLFAQMVDDPSGLPDDFTTEAAQEAERERLFDIIRALVKWENTTNETVLHAARVEIARSAARNHSVSLPREMTPAEVADALKRYAPPVLDPFAGGGSIPLEAQRLGLEAHASDLNPVAVLINKALIEIPPKLAGWPPVNPESRTKYLQREWKGVEGLADDVRYYGHWMRDEAFKRIGHLYPKVRLPKEHGGGEATVIAWLWARTVKCPNPACGVEMPLVHSFWLSSKRGNGTWVEPQLDDSTLPRSIRFTVRKGTGKPQSGTVGQRTATCIACGNISPLAYVREEGQSGRLGFRLLAVAVESHGKRIYLSPTEEHEYFALQQMVPDGGPETPMPEQALGFSAQLYGMRQHRNLFTPRQLVAMTTFTQLVEQARNLVSGDVAKALAQKGSPTAETNQMASNYADAVATYLAFGVDKTAEYNCTLVPWYTKEDRPKGVFARQTIPIVWDFAEVNPLGTIGGTLAASVRIVADALDGLPIGVIPGVVKQRDATETLGEQTTFAIATDPPYYDNIGYADLSDFFYVWLRRTLHHAYPSLFRTALTPKAQELVAEPFRHGGRDMAKRFFEGGLAKAFVDIAANQHQRYPLTVFYAYKQEEADDNGASERESAKASTGWETMLQGLIDAECSVSGTWPMHTERGGRARDIAANALASSIVLVCRPRTTDARPATRKDFLNALKRELPTALKELQHGNIAPVDLAQAAIGPGMAVFSRYSKVIEADGSAMRVRTALQLINQTLDEVLAEQEGEFDADTRFAVAWFEQYGMGQGKFGEADVLARAKNTSVGGLDEAGILEAHGGNVRLLRRDELPDAWNPHHDPRLSVWKVTQHLIHALMEGGGAQAAAAVLDAVGSDYGEKARDLAYRLYVTSERKKWTQDALAYNTLVTEWHDIAGGAEGIRERALERERATVRQATLIEE